MMQVQHYVAEKNVAEALLQEKIAETHDLRRSLGETHSQISSFLVLVRRTCFYHCSC